MENNKNYKLEKNLNDIQVSTADEARVLCIALAQQARRSIDLLSPHLDRRIFDSAGMEDAIRQLSINSRSTRIRILLKSSEPVIKSSHRLVHIFQSMSSTVEIRQIAEDYQNYNEAFVIFDRRGLIYHRNASRYEGIANFDRPRLATELTNFFDEIWDRSEPDPNMRRLNI